MNVSTSLNIFYAPDVCVPDSVRRCAVAGFVSLDMNYWDHQKQMLQSSPQEEEAWAREIRASADNHGVRITQMHGPVHGSTFSNLAHGMTLESFEKLLERSLRSAAILGVPWVVLHPTNVTRVEGESFQEALEYNVNFYRKIIPVLEQTGVGIALENMIGQRGTRITHFALPEELVELIDTLNHPLVGACWDTGHGHITSLDQAASISTLGSRLKTTHIQDNDGTNDQHLLPYQGTIPWNEVVQTLKRIGYTGDFTYETHNSIRTLPDGIRDAGLKYALDLGNYVISL
ncbi:sugar phosphate isomerase/epimerase family protein [Paenibacillus agricola]|uniref:Sugar phosphate isomerase/epimerase n=1 Tax=Paenibacillus agricola TaxID=2716264 RepID=A0ABX0JF30_9BACL|nr:sugar phosphate isomerase/epimerase family protein [Paenibacillus agricola]NHN34508.1 sugar phosphate isomerase/epimerase [Paenibacillus agricola]